jgi:hypothetical protein
LEEREQQQEEEESKTDKDCNFQLLCLASQRFAPYPTTRIPAKKKNQQRNALAGGDSEQKRR